MKNKTICISICLLVFNSLIPTSFTIAEKSLFTSFIGNILYVGGEGPGNYSDIQDAIDEAYDGDIIFVYDDSSPYFERLIVNKSINLIGEKKETTVIDAYNNKNVVYVSADWVNISGFTIRRSGSDDDDAGICINSNFNNITGNNISYNGVGIYIKNSLNNVITNNNIRTNLNPGILLYNSSNNIIINNDVICNGGGILFDYCNGNNIISVNTIISNKGYGIRLWYSGSNNSIIDNRINSNSYAGINLYTSSHNNIKSNIISNNKEGFRITHSNDNVFSDNALFNDGFYFSDSSQNIFSNNMVNDRSFVYLSYESDLTINDAGQVILTNCNNITVQNQEIYNVEIGMELQNTHNCTIKDNTITLNNREGIILNYCSNNNITGNKIAFNLEDGIRISQSSRNTIIGNSISTNGDWFGGDGIDLDRSNDNNIINNDFSGHTRGILLRRSSNNNIKRNIIFKNYYGMYMDGSHNNAINYNEITSNNELGILIRTSNINTIKGNTISNNKNGIEFSSSNNNSIIDNKIISNIEVGMMLSNSDKNNIIYHNNFINNGDNAYDYGNNTWDDGKYGNYWSDYKEKYPNAKRIWLKGIWDTPYEIPDGYNNDTCPLIMQWSKSLSKTIVKNMNIENMCNIRVKTIDAKDAGSLWFNSLHVSMLRNKFFDKLPILQRILELLR